MTKTVASVLSANLNAQDLDPLSAGMPNKQGHNMSDERIYSLANDLPRMPAQLTHYEDDISLVDVALLVVKHKKVLLGVFAGIMLLGLFAITSMPKTYDYKAVLEVGSYRLPEQDGVLGKRQEIESITQVKSKLEKRFISSALLAYNQQYPDAGLPNVKVSAPAESNVVELSIKGDQGKLDQYNALLKQITTDLIADHDEKLLDVREQVMQSIEKQRIKVGEYAAKLENAKANQGLLKKSIAELNQEKAMLTQQLNRLDRNLEKINQLKAQYNAGPQNAREGITLLLLDNQLIETQKLRDELESMSVVGLSRKLASYASELAANEQTLATSELMYVNAQQALQRYLGPGNTYTESDTDVTNSRDTERSANNADKVAVAKSTVVADAILRAEPILNVNPTSLVVAPHRSAEPASFPRTVSLGLLLFLAVFLSLMSVFVYEFVQKVKSQARLS